MAGTKKAKYTHFLPPTPCTEAMRGEISRIAEQKGESLAEIQRSAISLFLEGFYSKTIEPASQANQNKELSR